MNIDIGKLNRFITDMCEVTRQHTNQIKQQQGHIHDLEQRLKIIEGHFLRNG